MSRKAVSTEEFPEKMSQKVEMFDKFISGTKI